MLQYAAFNRIARLIKEAVTGNKKKPTYVCLKPDRKSQNEISSLISSLGLSDGVPDHELHATVTYSSAAIADPTEDVQKILPATATGDQLTLFDTRSGTKCLVLKLKSLDLHSLHVLIKKKYGASHDFPSYEAHVTLCYDVPATFKIPPEKPDISIRFDDFAVKDLDDK